MSQGVCSPILLADLIGSICLIVLSALCLRESKAIVRKEPENFLYGYIQWLIMALFAFSLSRSLGHIVKHFLWYEGLLSFWKDLSPISGSINSALFILIASITVFFQKMKSVMERIEQDRQEIERISQELLRLNKETELLVSERTRAELALSIAHRIRNPIMVIGGLAKRLIKKGQFTADQLKKVELMIQQIESLENIVREFELIKGRKSSKIEKKELNDLINEIVESASSEAKSRGLDIEVRVEKGPIFVSIDADLIRFSLIECLKLIMDRSKHSKKIWILVKREKFGATVMICSLDLETCQQKTVADQKHDSLRRSGRGLGLSTVRQILRDHGGELRIEGRGDKIKIIIFLPFKIGTGKTWSVKKLK